MKTRVQSSSVLSQMRKGGFMKKRNLRAYKVVVRMLQGFTEEFFEEARIAHRVALGKAKKTLGKVEIHENVGGEKFELLAIYENSNALPA